MIIQTFPCQPLSTNAFVVVCPTTRHAAIIDPAPGAASVVAKYLADNNLLLDKIILTHSHWDHIADAAALKKAFNVPVYVHPLDKDNLETPGADGLQLWVPIEGVKGSHPLEEGDTIKVGDINFTIIHTPGHTPGGICLYCKEEGVLFSGDTLFRGSIGNLSLPTANASSMWNSLKKLSTLPPETKVYPGHGPSTTIQQEAWLKDAERMFGSY